MSDFRKKAESCPSSQAIPVDDIRSYLKAKFVTTVAKTPSVNFKRCVCVCVCTCTCVHACVVMHMVDCLHWPLAHCVWLYHE